jgi:AcrR family transcriptional regulator
MTRRKRFEKEDWLTLGLTQLAAKGSAGLTVEALCKIAERTRGSFYHHFSDHGEFIEAMMSFWKKQNTLDVAEETLREEQQGRAQKLSDLANNLDLSLERSIRQFAQSNVTAGNILKEVDEIRTNFVAGLYEKDGLDPVQAREIAMIEYAAYVGAQIVWPDMPVKERVRLDRQFAVLVKKAKETDRQQN